MKELGKMTKAEMQAELAGYRAGVDETPVPDGVVPTTGQMWFQLLSLPVLGRMELLERIQSMIERSSRCFTGNHDIEIRALRQERDNLARNLHNLQDLYVRPTAAQEPDPVVRCGSPAKNGKPCILTAGHNVGNADVPSNHYAP